MLSFATWSVDFLYVGKLSTIISLCINYKYINVPVIVATILLKFMVNYYTTPSNMPIIL